MKDRFVIDSNILIYALNRDAEEKHEKAYRFLNKARNKEAAIPAQCIAETFFQVLKKDVETGKARRAMEDILRDDSFRIIEYGSRELHEAVKAEENFWDRLIEQTSLENDYETIYTENTSDFKKIEAINPLP